MLFLLDTDIVSNFRKPKPHPNLIAWMDGLSADEIAVSAITIFEIQAGIAIIRTTDPLKAREIESWLQGFILAGRLSILPIDAAVARLYAELFVTPSLGGFVMAAPKSRKPKSGADLIVAATAIVWRATVVTANRLDFLRIHREFPLPGLYEPFGMTWDVGAPPQPA